jgi:branched-chain amino acid transport system substrate-binding protein
MITDRIAKVALFCLIAALIGGLFGCEQLFNIFIDGDMSAPSPDPVVVVKEREVVHVGLVLPLTGSAAGPYGLSMERGYLLARDDINSLIYSGARINFITIDDMSTAEGQVDAFNRLVEMGVPAIVGIGISTNAIQSLPIAQENQVVALSSLTSASGLTSIGDYIFRTALATDVQNPRGVQVTHAELGYEKVAMIYDDADVWSTSSHEELDKALNALGVEKLATQTFQTGDTDFTEQLNAIIASNPDALFISGLSAEVVGVMMQGRELGLPSSVPYIVPELGVYDVERAGDAAEGTITFTTWISASDAPYNQMFVESYRNTYGIEPDAWAAQSYAALYILYGAIAKAQYDASIESPSTVLSTDSKAIRDALATAQDVETILGTFSFDANGNAIYDPFVLVVRAGNFEMFGDADMP